MCFEVSMIELGALYINNEKNNYSSVCVFEVGQVKWSMVGLCDTPLVKHETKTVTQLHGYQKHLTACSSLRLALMPSTQPDSNSKRS
jgi:hypothetical protein